MDFISEEDKGSEEIIQHICHFPYIYPLRSYRSQIFYCMCCYKPFLDGILVTMRGISTYTLDYGRFPIKYNEDILRVILFNRGHAYLMIQFWQDKYISHWYVKEETGDTFIHCTFTLQMRIGLRKLQNRWRAKRKCRRLNHLLKIQLLKFDKFTNQSLISSIVQYAY